MKDNKTWKTGYVSEAGKFLETLEDIEGATTEARRAEEAKYRDIMGKRDHISKAKKNDKLWKDF